MNEIDLRRFDLNLLVVFEVLMANAASRVRPSGSAARNRRSAIRYRDCASSLAIHF
jgi:hypothetical protein